MEEYGTSTRVVLRTLSVEDAAATMALIAAGQLDRCLLPWIALMHGGDDPIIISQWREAAQGEPDALLRAQYGALALTFADLGGRASIWKRELEGWNMGESRVINEWRAEGRLAGERLALKRFLQGRFRLPLPGDLQTAIDGQTDLAVLARWIDAAAIVSSLDDFRSAVQQ